MKNFIEPIITIIVIFILLIISFIKLIALLVDKIYISHRIK